MDTDVLERMKFVLRESEMPMFTDKQLTEAYEHAKSMDGALYELLMIKAENTELKLSEMTIQDTSAYFRRLAATYRPHNSGILGG